LPFFAEFDGDKYLQAKGQSYMSVYEGWIQFPPKVDVRFQPGWTWVDLRFQLGWICVSSQGGFMDI
jgi:hypothetical protein